MNLPKKIKKRGGIDPKLAVGSSLSKPKELLAIVFTLYIVNEEKDHLKYSVKNGERISLNEQLIDKLKLFFSDINDYNESEIDKIGNDNPLLSMQIEPLQVTLQLFWKLATINIIGSNSSSSERSGGKRFPKELHFTTNMDILKSTISDEDENITLKGKKLLYSWMTNKETPTDSKKLETKLKKILLIFSEETLYKLWDGNSELLFLQEGIYQSLDDTTNVDLKGTKEVKGTLRNLKSFISKDMHPYIKISSNNVEIKDVNLLDDFKYYKNRVTTFLDLNPKSINIIPIQEQETEDIKIQNIIYYGAPGTGKSHKVKELLKGKEKFTERITFHPEYDYASFIGGYKPITEKDAETNKEEIKYKFVPQAFTNIYVNAWNDIDSENQYYLVIEEINRGNCAEIFGDIFQLLDRNPEYKITPSNELKEYLEKSLTDKGLENGKMVLPSNLHILATMNTSDQSLFPMDSAFKRRWDWEYIPINYEKNENNPSSKFKVKLSETEEFSWVEFIEKVNKDFIQVNPNLGMDKCIGNYFIKAVDNKIELSDFVNKAIFYLWNDVFKDEEEHIFEENTFYEDFFPIDTNGKEQVLKMLEKIGLNKPKED